MDGQDYSATSPVSVVIPVSAMDNDSVCVNISVWVIDDHIVEFPENFTIELIGSTPPLEIGAASVATVTIIDNDGELMIEVLSFTSLVPRPKTAGLGPRLVFHLLV